MKNEIIVSQLLTDILDYYYPEIFELGIILPGHCFVIEWALWASSLNSCCEMWKLDLFPGEGDELKDMRKEGRPN
jgi:hypothetical protein